MHFQIIVFHGFDELDAIGPYEVLRNVTGTDAVVELVTVGEEKEVTASHGLRILPFAQLNLKQRPDVVIVPGGGWIDRALKGARAEAERGLIPEALKSLHQSGTVIAAVCTGAMLLAAAGILRGASRHHPSRSHSRFTSGWRGNRPRAGGGR